MKTSSTHSCWQLPSLLCLDAPLVAVGWAILFSLSHHGSFAQPPYLLGLFFAVWSIYLFDRLYDTRTHSKPDLTPFRHVWAREHRLLLSLLFVASSIAVLTIAFTKMDLSLWKKAWPVALATCVYFVLFPFQRFSGFASIPIKEIMIGTCFAGGVVVASQIRLLPEDETINAAAVILWLGCSVLFTWNCLIIAHAEISYDRRHDPASYFAKKLTTKSPHRLCCGLILFLSFGLALVPEYRYAALSLASCGLLLFWLGKKTRHSGATPIIADGILLFPWVIIGIHYLTR